MRRFVTALIAVIFLTGCGKTYLAEREFWKANRVLESAHASYQTSQNPEDLNPALEAFQQVVDQYPSTPKAAESLFIITNLYVKQGNFDASRQTLDQIVRDHGSRKDMAPRARYRIATLHEQEGNWKRAEQAYWDTSEYHPFHQLGAFAPVHIISHYVAAKDEESAERVYDRAVAFYERLFKKMGPIKASGIVKYHEGLAHLAYEKWLKARETWLEIAEEFPDSPYAPSSLLAAAELSWKRKDLGTAIEVYENFMTRHPRHNMAPRVTLQLGIIHMEKKDFATAREWFEKGIEYRKEKPARVAEFRLLIARSYQAEGLWDEANRLYDEIRSEYENTAAALQVPLMKAAYYESEGQTQKAHQVLDEAIEQYLKLEAATPGGLKAAYIHRLLNRAYAQKGDWQKILDNFDRRISEEESRARKGSWLFLKALVTENRVNDIDNALLLYEKFLEEYPEHSLSSVAKKRRAILKAEEGDEEIQQVNSVE